MIRGTKTCVLAVYAWSYFQESRLSASSICPQDPSSDAIRSVGSTLSGVSRDQAH